MKTPFCGPAHWNRRNVLTAAGALWLTPLARLLARQHEAQRHGGPAKSVIMLWLAGGPSQLETFDPHPGADIAGESKAIATSVPGVQLAEGFERLADQMQHIALIRSVVSKEGDHERATYNVKTGYRPDPTLVHPAIGAVVCRQLEEEDQGRVEIPRHVSILPGPWPARGGYLGDRYDAFKVGDPNSAIPDVESRVPDPRAQRRIKDLFDVVETEFARGRLQNLDAQRTLHGVATRAALKMMSSEQLNAFDVSQEPLEVQQAFGGSQFGRGCLAAVRLVSVGVRCVEVTLNGWDSHINNHELQRGQVDILDPAFAALISELKRRELFDSTIIFCGGEFGRTPRINPAGGRDHWPHGFSVALAGGGVQGGRVYGETSPTPDLDAKTPDGIVVNPRNIADVHATMLHALGIRFEEELSTPIGRPMAISQGQVIREVVG